MTMQSDAKNLPTEPGWYFARVNSAIKCHIQCVLVIEYGDRLIPLSMTTEDLNSYIWFGKVPMPVEID